MIDASRRAVLRAGIGLGLGWRLGLREAVGRDDRAAAVRPRRAISWSSQATREGAVDAARRSGRRRADDGVAMEPINRAVRSGSRLNQILLLRLAPDKLTAETRARAADGVVAYTSICTHTGCDVDTWLAAEQLLSCPCHDSMFDPKDGARVVDGPAPRVLPALPLKIVDGNLVVAKPFTAPIGFEKG
jgi:Rieske Fe-S protein